MLPAAVERPRQIRTLPLRTNGGSTIRTARRRPRMSTCSGSSVLPAAAVMRASAPAEKAGQVVQTVKESTKNPYGVIVTAAEET